MLARRDCCPDIRRLLPTITRQNGRVRREVESRDGQSKSEKLTSVQFSRLSHPTAPHLTSPVSNIILAPLLSSYQPSRWCSTSSMLPPGLSTHPFDSQYLYDPHLSTSLVSTTTTSLVSPITPCMHGVGEQSHFIPLIAWSLWVQVTLIMTNSSTLPKGTFFPFCLSHIPLGRLTLNLPTI